MELVKDIYFNTDKLVENTNVKISYTGKFYQAKNDKVFIHYGYGQNWSNINEVEMKKTDLGYQTELHLLNSNTLNFCFKNQNNEWDNNFGKNYIFNIEKSTANNINKTPNTIKEKVNVLPFWGKQINNSNNCTNETISNSGIVNSNVSNTPDSIDTFISKQQTNNNNNVISSFSGISPVGSNGLNNNNNIQAGNINKGSNIYNPINTNNINGNIGNTGNISNTENTGINNFKGNNYLNNTTITTVIPNKTSVNNSTINNNITKNNANINNLKPNTNAIALVPTGLQKTFLWTQKLKKSVCEFFSYVPKFIAGNYKRDINTKNNENK